MFHDLSPQVPICRQLIESKKEIGHCKVLTDNGGLLSLSGVCISILKEISGITMIFTPKGKITKDSISSIERACGLGMCLGWRNDDTGEQQKERIF